MISKIITAMFTSVLKCFIRTSSRLYSKLSMKSALCDKSQFKSVTSKNIVFITGSDSGLGFNLALFCHSLNMTVIAGCLNIESEGVKLLKSVSEPERIIPIEIDVTKLETIFKACNTIEQLTENDYEFTALVNNAGVMCFGEFEWQTPAIFESQIDVNLLGPMRVTHQLLPFIRKHCSRIINVTSHCGLQALPGLSSYTASKAGLRFWTEALRMELKKYDVKVVNFVPGSFVGQSNIAARQAVYAEEMWKNFSEQQKKFYRDYFDKYNSYLSILTGEKIPIRMNDSLLFEKFQHAILSPNPKNMYIHEPRRYAAYHWLFKISPTPLHDYFVKKFISMPQYTPKK